MPSFIEHLAHTTRSNRRFREIFPVTPALMEKWVDNTRYCASTKNLQPLRYHVVADADTNAKVFDTLAWAGYLTDWDGPEPGERPTGYIVMAVDTDLCSPKACQIDVGICAQTIMLGATEEGFGGCMIMSFKKAELKEILDMPENLEPVLVLALGRPIEDIRVVDMKDGDYTYYRDENKVHYVPKRSLESILF
jgi:nitroreductase